MKQLEKGEASLVDLKKNLEYAASVLEFLYTEETRQGNTLQANAHKHSHTPSHMRETLIVVKHTMVPQERWTLGTKINVRKSGKTAFTAIPEIYCRILLYIL